MGDLVDTGEASGCVNSEPRETTHSEHTGSTPDRGLQQSQQVSDVSESRPIRQSVAASRYSTRRWCSSSGPRCFLFWLGCLTFTQALMVSGYLSSVLTTVEKRFSLRSSESGLLVSCFDLGSLAVVVFVSYRGGRGRRPRWVGAGGLLVALGALVFALPHFVAPRQHGAERPWASSTAGPLSLTGSGQHRLCVLRLGKTGGKELEEHGPRAWLAEWSQTGLSEGPRAVLDDEPGTGMGETSNSGLARWPGSSLGEGPETETERDPTRELDWGSGSDYKQDEPEEEDPGSQRRGLPLALFVVGQLLVGIGSTPIYTLGATYLDDNVEPSSSALYLATLYVTGALGPAAGYLLGGLLVGTSANPGEPSPVPPGDPRFIGNWWGGFVLCAATLLLVAMPLFTFPKKMSRRRESSSLAAVEERAHDDDAAAVLGQESTFRPRDDKSVPVSTAIAFGKDIRELPGAAWRILRRPTFLLVSLSYTAECAIVTAFVTFTPKFLEAQFGVPASRASVYTGAVIVPGAGAGLLLGGYAIKRLSLGVRGAARLALGCSALSLLSFLLLLATVACHEEDAAIGAAHATGYPASLARRCGVARCQCEGHEYSPVCGSDGVTYLSPCLAGCTAAVTRGGGGGGEVDDGGGGGGGGSAEEAMFTSCLCVTPGRRRSDASLAAAAVRAGSGRPAEDRASPGDDGGEEAGPAGYATPGKCPRKCHTLAPFLAFLFAVTLVTAGAQPAVITLTLRSVEETERPFALGIQFVLLRALAYIPTPVYFGAVIDTTCVLWSRGGADGDGGGDGVGRGAGSCWEYDTRALALVIFTLAAALKLLGFVFIAMACHSTRRPGRCPRAAGPERRPATP